MNDRCACICSCGDYRARDYSDLCANCWRLWCLAEGGHGPVADRSYMGTYGMTGPWLAWLLNRAPHLVAEPASFLQRRQMAPNCHCGYPMVARPGAWKCYRHGEEPVVLVVQERFPRSPQASVLP
jgi:hypothetical protein